MLWRGIVQRLPALRNGHSRVLLHGRAYVSQRKGLHGIIQLDDFTSLLSFLHFQGCALALRQFLELRMAVVGFLAFFDGLVNLILIIIIAILIVLLIDPFYHYCPTLSADMPQEVLNQY